MGLPMRRIRAVFVLLPTLLFAGECTAHSSRTASPGDGGLRFSSATHGELLVLSAYRGEIVALAKSVTATDPDFRRLMNYAAIEFSYCGWGLAPFALTDEESPFNECSHAYLSAKKALLVHMRGMPAVAKRADALISRIDAAMVREGASFVGCQYSGEDFSTASFVTPHWELLWSHTPSAASAGGVIAGGLALMAACLMPWRRRREPLPHEE